MTVVCCADYGADASAAGADAGEDGCAVVLTTHSMEEVEVLCSRVGIMHRGRLACLGSPQRLKALYGGALQHTLFSVSTRPFGRGAPQRSLCGPSF